MKRRRERSKKIQIQKPALPIWPGDDSRYLSLAGLTLVVLLTLIIYGQTLAVPPIDYEDAFYLVRNPYVNVANPFSRLRAVWTEPYFANFHPVTTTTWLIDRAFGREGQPLDGLPFRVTHLLYAAACAASLIFLYRRLGLPPVLAVFGAVLYAVHPIHTEVVAWLSARKDLTSLIFIISSFLAYLWALASTTPAQWRQRHLVTLLLCLLAVLSKPISVVLPVLFVAYEFCSERPAELKGRLSPILARTLGLAGIFFLVGGPSVVLFRNLLSGDPMHGAWLMSVPIGLALLLLAVAPRAEDFEPFLAGSHAGLRVIGPPLVVHSVVFGAGSAWTLWAQSAAGAIKGGFPFLMTLNLTLDAMLAYAGKTLVPAFMTTVYGWSELPTFSVRGGLGGLLVLGLAVFGVRLAGAKDRNLRMVAFGIFWYLIAFIPVSNFVPTSTKMADRYLFVPSVGAILALLALASFLISGHRTKQLATCTAIALVVVAYTASSYERTSVWCGKTTTWKGQPHPDLSIWSRAVETHPDDAAALTSLALVYLRFDPPAAERALPLLERAMRLSEIQQEGIPEGKRLDISPLLQALGDAHLALARGKLSKEQIPNAREKKRDALIKAVGYLGEASLTPLGFAPTDARLLRSLAEAREELARMYQEELTSASGETRQALVPKRDRLRQEAEEALKHAKEILFAGNASRSDPEFRNVVLAEGTIVFGREAGASSEERAHIFRKALAHYQKAATLFPDDPRPVFYAGLCYERLYRLEHAPREKRELFESAESAFRKALGLSISAPEYHPLLPYRGLASLYTTAGDFRSALDVLRKVQQSDPSYSRANGVDREIQSIERYLKLKP